MAVTAKMVKELREMTGAGMMDCKKALNETDGDMDAAIEFLRKNGEAKAVKKAGRIAAEGIVMADVKEDKTAAIVEVNSETDFVAKNEQFLKLVDTACKTILASNATTNEEALALPVDGKTLNDLFIDATATIGEKIVLRRFALVEKSDSEIFGSYIHMGGKISCLVVLEGGDEALAKDMAMQIASMSPTYVSSADMPQDVVEHERAVQTEIVKNNPTFAGKPERVIEGAINGKVSKSLKEMCLVDQEFFKDPGQKVAAVLKSANASVKCFVKYLVGEGLEKREENFAEEVAKQMA